MVFFPITKWQALWDKDLCLICIYKSRAVPWTQEALILYMIILSLVSIYKTYSLCVILFYAYNLNSSTSYVKANCAVLRQSSKYSSMTLAFRGEGNGTPLQYSCLENPMDGGAWSAAVHGVAKSRTQLNVFTFTFHFHALEKDMATHSSVLAWRIPGTREPGGLPSVGSHRVGHDWSDLAAVAACI